jgi:hypothetical protein
MAGGDRVASLLRVLNHEKMERQLPPIDWKFLSEMAALQQKQRPEVESLCYSIASKQSPHSM